MWFEAVQAAIHLGTREARILTQMNADKRDERRYVVSPHSGSMVRMA
jgi:hypothetical protein